ncbi:hypothetical protein JZ751_005299 [Albula glossodonta]|uniref:EGF-like domain-containing protein n=1 Tax=Albula glossodonta TaxID=121402 RepID=A0A8T2NFZ3_9TELE|nr:hypothetical protein JZ751_005299 [Albula glossodonta]
MVPPRLSALLALATLLCSFSYVTTVEELPYFSREKVEKSLEVMKDGLNAVRDVMSFVETKKVTDLIKQISSIATLAPGFGALAGAIINCALAFLPQNDPVLDAVKEGFKEVNLKMDSLSLQISNLKTEVQWSNYASIYSQDETNILNSWKKYEEFTSSSPSARTKEEKLRLAERFTTFYENTATEGSVASLYQYLTVKQPSLRLNLLSILAERYKCDAKEVTKYSLHFRFLLWKGLLLNQIYYDLRGFNANAKAKESADLFLQAIRANVGALRSCIENYVEYMKADVTELSKAQADDSNTDLAVKIKKALDKKYYWYDWIVVVFKTEEKDKHTFINFEKIPVDEITVAVGHMLPREEEVERERINKKISTCIDSKYCKNLVNDLLRCVIDDGNQNVQDIILKQYAAALYVADTTEVFQSSKPFFTGDCWYGKVFVYLKKFEEVTREVNRRSVCTYFTCQNGGTCRQLLDTQETLCDCKDGYHGHECQSDITEEKNKMMAVVTMSQPVPDLTSIFSMLTKLETKLDKIYKSLPQSG